VQANLNIRRAALQPIDLSCDDRRPRLGGAVTLLVGLARRAAGFLLRFELRQSKLLPHMITAHEQIVVSEAVHQKTVRCLVVELYRKRAILGAMSWPCHAPSAPGHAST